MTHEHEIQVIDAIDRRNGGTPSAPRRVADSDDSARLRSDLATARNAIAVRRTELDALRLGTGADLVKDAKRAGLVADEIALLEARAAALQTALCDARRADLAAAIEAQGLEAAAGDADIKAEYAAMAARLEPCYVTPRAAAAAVDALARSNSWEALRAALSRQNKAIAAEGRFHLLKISIDREDWASVN